MPSVSKKSAYGVLFRDLRRFPLVPARLPGGKHRKETLLRKAFKSAAHVAGFGLHLEGFGPPNLPEGFFDSLSRGMMCPCSACRKSPPAASFSEYLHCFPLGSMSLPGGKQCKETLLRKASESAAHVAGFGLHLEGYGPPNLPKRFFDSLKRPLPHWARVACRYHGRILSR